MTILTFLLVLVVLIFVHELGHFLAAKKFGIRVDEFGLGFPPKIVGKKFGETEYTLNLLPIGGFVRIFGENPNDDSIRGPDASRSFVHVAKWKQAIVLVAGVTFNILFAWILFTSGFVFGMPTAVQDSEAHTVDNPRLLITQLLPEAPADQAGLKTSDEITAVYTPTERIDTNLTAGGVSDFIVNNADEQLTFEVIRRGEAMSIAVTPQAEVIAEDPERKAVGMIMSLSGITSLPLHRALYEGARMTVDLLGAVTVGIISFLYDAVTFSADLTQVAGPVGIVGLVGDASALGFAFLITFTAFISLNLAVINLLPFPALDGGRLLFVLIEKIKGSPIKPSVANAFNTVGFALLILLMVAVTYKDILNLL